jgi:predicted transcriptional regulator
VFKIDLNNAWARLKHQAKNHRGNTMDNKVAVAQLAADIVASYVTNNDVARTDLPKLILEVYGALTSAMDGKADFEAANATPRAIGATKKTIFPDYLICLEDGKRFKSLKRHLRTAFKLTPESYREKWGLAADYPMVAPNYAKTRSALAKNIGLGKKLSKKK